MRITLDIKEQKSVAFVNFIKSLDFIKIHNQDNEDVISRQDIFDDIEQGMQEVKLHQEGKIKLTSAKDFLNEL